jgi:hypothetical protein
MGLEPLCLAALQLPTVHQGFRDDDVLSIHYTVPLFHGVSFVTADLHPNRIDGGDTLIRGHGSCVYCS